jgi:hypothetical protein
VGETGLNVQLLSQSMGVLAFDCIMVARGDLAT